MNTRYEEIVNVGAIGKAENPISLNEILKKANDEQLTPSKQNKERVLFIGVQTNLQYLTAVTATSSSKTMTET